MISLKYIDSSTDILRLFSLIHLADPLPDAILIDGLQRYYGQPIDHLHHGLTSDTRNQQHKSKESLFCKILAVLKDSAEYISQKKGENCFIAASFTGSSSARDTTTGGGGSGSGGDGRILHICQRWLPILCDIKGMYACVSIRREREDIYMCGTPTRYPILSHRISTPFPPFPSWLQL
jgi:hypothetical protein